MKTSKKDIAKKKYRKRDASFHGPYVQDLIMTAVQTVKEGGMSSAKASRSREAWLPASETRS